jgi:hypothetical protein
MAFTIIIFSSFPIFFVLLNYNKNLLVYQLAFLIICKNTKYHTYIIFYTQISEVTKSLKKSSSHGPVPANRLFFFRIRIGF